MVGILANARLKNRSTNLTNFLEASETKIMRNPVALPRGVAQLYTAQVILSHICKDGEKQELTVEDCIEAYGSKKFRRSAT